MDIRALSSSSSQAPYQRVPSLSSSAQIMDPDNTNNQYLPSTTTAATGPGLSAEDSNATGGGYVYPSADSTNRQFNNGSNSYSINTQTPFQYPDHRHHQVDDADNHLSSSAPLRLDDPSNNNRYEEPDSTSSAAAEAAYLLPTITPPGKILLLQTLTTLSTIVFTVIPVVIKAGPEANWGNWYTWKDAVRLLEPFVSGLFHSWFFYSSDHMRRWNRDPGVGGGGVGYDKEEEEDEEEERRDYRTSSTGSWGNVALDDKQEANNGQGIRSGSNIPLNDRHRQNQHQQQYHSPPTTTKGSSWKQTPTFKALLANTFTFFLILYVTGAAIHTAAALFKNILVLFLEQYSQGIGLSTHSPTTGDGQLPLALATQLKEGYLLIQDTWEHNISHYMYAFGALGMSWCEMVAYSGQVLPVGINLARVGQVSTKGSRLGVRSKKSSKRLVLLWILAGVLYGGIVAGVACQYPKGLYVGLAYIGALFLILVIYILSHPTRGLFTLGRHYILQTYLIATVVAAVAIVIYLAVHDFEFLTSNDKSHLASITRP
ncbi:hypothetical protein BGW39_004833 [Mortierella sp. 14UC]|nr:hypothetical protein BGW39_004833 [Mortierella sp. 14UC]